MNERLRKALAAIAAEPTGEELDELAGMDDIRAAVMTAYKLGRLDEELHVAESLLGADVGLNKIAEVVDSLLDEFNKSYDFTLESVNQLAYHGEITDSAAFGFNWFNSHKHIMTFLTIIDDYLQEVKDSVSVFVDGEGGRS